MHLNNLDFSLFYKNKIDPFYFFKSIDGTNDRIVLNVINNIRTYIIYLIRNGINIPPEYFSKIADSKLYRKTVIKSPICLTIINTLLDEGFDIEDEKYKDLLNGLEDHNDKLRFFSKVITNDIDFPLSLLESQYYTPDFYDLFIDMIDYNYSRPIPDIIIDNIKSNRSKCFSAISVIATKNRKSFFKYVKVFSETLVRIYKHIIFVTKDTLKEILGTNDNNLSVFLNYKNELMSIVKIFKQNNYLLEDKKASGTFLNFINSKDFRDNINIYIEFMKDKETTHEYKEFINNLEYLSNISVEESFKSFFYKNIH
jgi:hypothetical protein